MHSGKLEFLYMKSFNSYCYNKLVKLYSKNVKIYSFAPYQCTGLSIYKIAVERMCLSGSRSICIG